MGRSFGPVQKTDDLVGSVGFPTHWPRNLVPCMGIWEWSKWTSTNCDAKIKCSPNITQYSRSCFWRTPWCYQSSCQTWRMILLANLQRWCQRLDSPMCNLCCNQRATDTQLHGKLYKYNVGHSFERIAMDLAGPFPMSRKGNWHILVVANYFSKWCEAYPMPTIDVQEIAKVFVENWISHYGVPLEPHIDQGRNFKSKCFQKCASC